LAQRLVPALERPIERKREALAKWRLPVGRVRDRIAAHRRSLDSWGNQLTPEVMGARFAALAERLAGLDRVRQTLGYEATLARGYAVVRSGDGLVTRVKTANAAAALDIQLAAGRLAVGGVAKPAPKAKDVPPEQGSLL
jgi:exodeoxyribonuclease VII large subunit